MESSQQTDQQNSPAASTPLPTHEERLTAFREFGEYLNGKFPPGSLSSQYVAERDALKHLYPGTIVDLGRAGIVKVRAFGWDDVYDVEPDEEAES